MKKGLRKIWDGFRRWVKYMRDYKENVDNDFIYDQNIAYANNKIEELKQKIQSRDEIILAKENLIKLRDKKIQRLTKKINTLKKKVEN